MANEEPLDRFKRDNETALERGIIALDDEEKNVVYVALNKKYRLSNPEELVRASAYASLVLEYGYLQDQIEIEYTVPHRVPNIHSDIVVFKDGSKTTAYIVVECKREDASQGV